MRISIATLISLIVASAGVFAIPVDNSDGVVPINTDSGMITSRSEAAGIVPDRCDIGRGLADNAWHRYCCNTFDETRPGKFQGDISRGCWPVSGGLCQNVRNPTRATSAKLQQKCCTSTGGNWLACVDK